MSSFERDSEKLTPKQNTLILALLSHPTIAEAAKVAKVPDSTARRWLRMPHVNQALSEAQQDVFDEAIRQLKLGTMAAIKQLQKDMLAAENDAAVRVRAATVLLSKSIEQAQATQLQQALLETMQQLEKERGS